MSPKVASFTFGEIPYEAEQFVSVMCSVLQGDLPIRITWELNKQPLFSNNEIVIVQTSKRTSALSIESVSEKHVGNYSCIGMNEAGYDVHTASLLVNGLNNLIILDLYGI